MKKYIPLDALVAEIWKRRTKHFNFGGSPSSEYCHEDDEILSLINTLEVKEISEEYNGFLGKELKMVDDEIERLEKLKVKEAGLEKEIEKELETRWRGEYLYTTKFRESAKHFFELGLKAQKGE